MKHHLPELNGARLASQGEEPDRDKHTVLWVIYDHPKDYPAFWVTRRQWVGRDKVLVFDREAACRFTLEDARRAVPDGLFQIPHQPGEDPVIAETWI